MGDGVPIGRFLYLGSVSGSQRTRISILCRYGYRRTRDKGNTGMGLGFRNTGVLIMIFVLLLDHGVLVPIGLKQVLGKPGTPKCFHPKSEFPGAMLLTVEPKS